MISITEGNTAITDGINNLLVDSADVWVSHKNPSCDVDKFQSFVGKQMDFEAVIVSEIDTERYMSRDFF